MSILSWLRTKIHRQRKAARLGEPDAPGDLGTARTRATGGEPDPDAPDTHSTTGTTPGQTFVGRATGDDPGYTGRTGAERRAEGRHRADNPPDRTTPPPGDQPAGA